MKEFKRNEPAVKVKDLRSPQKLGPVSDENMSKAQRFKYQWELEQKQKDVEDYQGKQVIQAKVQNINESLMERLAKIKEQNDRIK